MSKRAAVTATIRNRLGLHARPAMAFVDCAMMFDSDVRVKRDEEGADEVDGKSIMQMMMLAATKGTTLAIEAEGDDAAEACKKLKKLVDSGFGEDSP